MKEPFSLQDLETIIAHQGKPAVTIYIPTSRIITRVQAEGLQLKNLLRIAGASFSERCRILAAAERGPSPLSR